MHIYLLSFVTYLFSKIGNGCEQYEVPPQHLAHTQVSLLMLNCSLIIRNQSTGAVVIKQTAKLRLTKERKRKKISTQTHIRKKQNMIVLNTLGSASQNACIQPRALKCGRLNKRKAKSSSVPYISREKKSPSRIENPPLYQPLLRAFFFEN